MKVEFTCKKATPTLSQGERMLPDGTTTPAIGFEFEGTFIVDPTESECGRFNVADPCAYYGLQPWQVACLVAQLPDQRAE